MASRILTGSLAEPTRIRHKRILTSHVIFGALLGYIILRLLTLGVYWYEFRREGEPFADFWHFAVNASQHFSPIALSLSGIMMLLGALLGLASGMFTVSLLRRELKLVLATNELGSSIIKLIGSGEDDGTEFKSSLRWDLNEKKPNRLLEQVVIKTIAGLLNNRGGNLIIGVADDGRVLGIETDYLTLKQQHQNRDGFAQLITTLVKTNLGADLCPFVYPVFHTVEDREVCRVMITRSPRPVYVKIAGATEFFLRTGNGTSALNVQEAVAYINQRWAHG